MVAVYGGRMAVIRYSDIDDTMFDTIFKNLFVNLNMNLSRLHSWKLIRRLLSVDSQVFPFHLEQF